MTKFDVNRYVVKVIYSDLIINAFEIPARNYQSAQLYAHNIVYGIYPDIEYEISVEQKYKQR